MKRIWLIRHGESIANAGEPTQDHSTIPLSTQGIKQAQALALQIPEEPARKFLPALPCFFP